MRATVDIVGKLHHTEAPTSRIGIASAEVDVGDGKLKVLAKTDEMIACLTAIGEGSEVEVKGKLKYHRWLVGSGQYRETFEVEPESIEVLSDARRGRMLP